MINYIINYILLTNFVNLDFLRAAVFLWTKPALCALSIFFKVELYEILILVVTSGITFSLELINTSIESLTDLVTTKNNNLAKIAKDSSAASLFIMVMITIISTLIIFVPKIINYIGEIV